MFFSRTPLHVAIESENIEIVSILISHHASLSIRDSRLMTPLDLSKSRNNKDISSLLEIEIQKYVKIHHSCYDGNLDMVRYLANKGYSVDSKYLYETFNNNNMMLGSTPMHFAVLGNNLSIVEYLINQKAEVNEKNDSISPI